MDSSRHKQPSRSPGRSARPTLERPPHNRREREGSSVAHDEQLVIDAMRDLGWGRIENLPIRGGVPRMTRDTKVLRRVRVGRHDGPRWTTSARRDRKPHQQHQKFLDACRGIGDGVLERIEVADGLPIYWKTNTKLAQRA